MSQIRVSGITFIKNGLSLGYPIAESIQSIDPLCDEIIINVGFENPECDRDDGTYAYLTNIFQGSKYRFLKSYWDPEKQSRGLILSEQTNIALAAAQGKYIHYIQGDEVVHEKDYSKIKIGLEKLDQHPHIHGLVFDYLHFYGNVDVIRKARTTYRREVRVLRNNCGFESFLDAQGFRGPQGEKVPALLCQAHIYHYGWARANMVMKKKVKEMDKLWAEGKEKESHFEYQGVWGLEPFKGTHPTIMQKWIDENKNEIDILSLPVKFEWKNFKLRLSKMIENITGYRVGEFKNYKLIHHP